MDQWIEYVISVTHNDLLEIQVCLILFLLIKGYTIQKDIFFGDKICFLRLTQESHLFFWLSYWNFFLYQDIGSGHVLLIRQLLSHFVLLMQFIEFIDFPWPRNLLCTPCQFLLDWLFHFPWQCLFLLPWQLLCISWTTNSLISLLFGGISCIIHLGNQASCNLSWADDLEFQVLNMQSKILCIAVLVDAN